MIIPFLISVKVNAYSSYATSLTATETRMPYGTSVACTGAIPTFTPDKAGTRRATNDTTSTQNHQPVCTLLRILLKSSQISF